MNKTVIFYGHLPKAGEIPIGGGEVGNSRTLRMLERFGYQLKVIRMQKPSLKWGAKLIKALYPLRVLSVIFRFTICLLFSSRKSIVHISGFAGVNVWSEASLMFIAKALGYFTIYEQRAGGAIQYYKEGSKRYRKCYGYILSHTDYIFTQGVENIPMMRKMTEKPVYHYPNCVEDSFAPSSLPEKPNDVLNLLYFGRVENTKHVDLIVKASSLIQKEYPNSKLTVIGGGFPDEISKVKSLMQQLLQKDSYTYIPGVSHDELGPMLKDYHFYIFPSTQPREGQSNSVTECMSFGIIPIASPQGFNSSTIGDDYLIVEDLTPEAYAAKAIEIVSTGNIGKYSKQILDRFNKKFRQSIVFEHTIKVYEEIFSGMEE